MARRFFNAGDLVIIAYAPLVLAIAWHAMAWLLSAGLLFIVVEEDGDLDSGPVALAILMMGVAGGLLSKLSGIGWPLLLVLALPSISMTILLLMRRNRT